MGNSARKGPLLGWLGASVDDLSTATRRRKRGTAPKPAPPPPAPAAKIQLSLRDVVYPASDVTQADDEVLRALREALAVDPEGFLLDNLLMAVQFFENYDEEVAELRRAFEAQVEAEGEAKRAQALPDHRELRPDALVQASARHVRWRPRASEPDRLVAPQRRIVVDDTLRLHSADSRATAGAPQPCPADTHYHLAMEAGTKPGHIKLRQVAHACSGDFQQDREDIKEEAGDYLAVNDDGVYLRPPGSRTGATPSPTSSVKSMPSLSSALSAGTSRRRRHSPRSVDSVITSDGSLSPSLISLSDMSASSNGRSRRLSGLVPLDEFRPNAAAAADANVVPEECFQPVMVQRRAAAATDDDDEDAVPEATELRVQSYLLAAPFFARFADAFHDSLAAAMDFPRESVVLATVRGAGGPAAIQCEQQPEPDDGQAVVQCEVFPALALPAWPRAAVEWVYRGRGAWPPRAAVRRAHSLGGVAVAAGSSDLSSLQWTLAFPGAEQLLELSLPAKQAHTYLTLLAMRHYVPGLTAHHIRAGFLRLVEQDQTTAAQDWSPGAALRHALAVMYKALQRRQLPDYFIAERNLLAEVDTSEVLHAQERVFRLREFTLPSVIKTCRRLAYVKEEGFYPRLDLDALTAILNGSAAAAAADPEPGRCAEGAEPRDSEHTDDTAWIDSYRRNFQGGKAQAAVRVRPARPPPISHDSIKLGRATEERRTRTASILKLFSEHFIRMAEASNKFNALQQARHYLRHALHLLILLEKDYQCPNDTKPLFDRLIETNA